MRDEVVIQGITISSMRDKINRAQRIARKFEKSVAELVTGKERSDIALARLEEEAVDLNRDNENSDVTMEKFEKEVAKMNKRENLAKKLAIDEFKASKEYKEVVEKEASSYFGEGFDQCKKQLKLRFLDLDIDDLMINSYLVDGDEDEVDEDKVVVQDATLPGQS